VFGVALVAMVVAGVMQWRGRSAACPTDPDLRDACLRTRRWSARIYGLSLLLLTLGAWFAFVQPLLGEA
jgi:gamma-glutamyl:cysteine ligase YbdK (ATP-grasp superfamily)